MKAITVDDEPLMLRALSKAVSASPDVSSVTEFGNCADALRWAEKNPVDLAFLDIEMRGMGGIQLAEKLKALQPRCAVIFCTGYEQYAISAFRIRVSGYLLKPISAAEVQAEIDHIRGREEAQPLLSVQCFGIFEVQAQGKALTFKRSKTKELLALLVDCKGAGITGREISARLWEDDCDEDKCRNYLRQLFMDLRHALEEVGAGAVLLQCGYSYSLDTRLIDCDYYSYLECGHPAFRGAYMTQYSWADETCGLLWRENPRAESTLEEKQK